MKEKPVCQSLFAWLKENLGPRCLAPLTPADSKALSAAVHLVALYASTGEEEVLVAFAIVVRQMQPTTLHLAYHAIAHVMDWHDRARIWNAASCPPCNPGRCKFEPSLTPHTP